jgi:poly-gamma-glutamate system protein
MIRLEPYWKGRITLRRLAILSLCAFWVFLLIETARFFRGDPLSAEKSVAAGLMREALGSVRDEKIRQGIRIDPILDPAGTGVIGAEYTDLTTTLGSLSAKRLSTHPEFAAVLVDMLGQAGVQPGDAVLVSFSGSFPALNIAVLSAAKALRLQPVVISSIGASGYGANEPEMTWADMERALLEKGIFPYRSAAASLGGVAGSRGGLDGTGISAGLRAIHRNGIPLLEEEGESTLPADIQRRLTIYGQALGDRRPAAFITVGGPLTSLGNGPEGLKLESGLLTKIPASPNPERGLIFRMGEKRIPVIHLLGIKKIARQYGIPAESLPSLDPAPGRGVRKGRYSPPLALTGLSALLLLLGFAGKPSTNAKGRGRSARA